MKGKLARVTDEALGFGVAGEIAEVVGVAGGKLLCRIQKAGGSKLGRNVTVSRSQLTLQDELPDPLPMKKLLLNQDQRVELDTKFPPIELEKGISLKKDSRLASMHIDMCWWMLSRDLSLIDKEIAYLEPEFSATTVYQMSLHDGAESLVEALATLGTVIGDAKLILVPVWGGTDGSEHWTLLQLEKKDVWSASYKDSLSVKCTSCADVAAKLLTVISMSLNQDVQMPENLANAAKQKIASGSCGYYIVHWMEEACRRFLGEGKMANGYPDPMRWFTRLETLVAQVKKNKGISLTKMAKIEAKVKELKDEEDKKAETAAKLAADDEFQKNAKKLSIEFRSRTWASTGGCPKCRFSKVGSTCCNPDKILALKRAREIKKKEMEEQGLKYAADSYDTKTYNAQLEEVYKEIAASKSLPAPPSVLKPAGGQADKIIII